MKRVLGIRIRREIERGLPAPPGSGQLAATPLKDTASVPGPLAL